MAKAFGVKPYLFPMPTYMIGTYNEDGTGRCDDDGVGRHLRGGHGRVKP